jgi:hypothetical protein
MKKLSLALDTLAVETFETTAAELDLRGTVHGHATWQYNGCTAARPCNPSSSPDYTMDNTCQDTCMYSCPVSCGGSCDYSCNCPTQRNTCWETCQPTVPC